MRDDHRPIIGVIGGEGQMGRWLRAFWQGLGHEVLFSDRQTALQNGEVIERAEITFVAVPLHATPAVIAQLAPLVPAGHALASIASLMGPSAEALAAATGDALCAHPVFGPTVTGTAGLPVVVAPVRGERWCRWLEEVLRAAGLRVRRSTPQDHDAAMSVVQAQLHSLYVALCAAMATAGLPPAVALEWASPTLRLQIGLVARILSQDPQLYAELVVGNALAPARLEELASELLRLAALARAGDRPGFIQAFLEARAAVADQDGTLAARAEEALERFA